MFQFANVQIFKLVDHMRSMRTNGASKNRDYCDPKWLSFSSHCYSVFLGVTWCRFLEVPKFFDELFDKSIGEFCDEFF